MAPKTDLLSLPYQKRMEAEQRMIAMHLEGISNREIARELGLFVYTVNHRLDFYRQSSKNDQCAISRRKGGNLPGSRVLTDEQRARMRSDLFNCRPDQINPEWLLWDR